ncbi:MAG: hypothetical protein AAB361_01615 [Patescibacteria group bacterium]
MREIPKIEHQSDAEKDESEVSDLIKQSEKSAELAPQKAELELNKTETDQPKTKKGERTRLEFTPISGRDLEGYRFFPEIEKKRIRQNWEVQIKLAEETKRYFKERQKRAKQILEEKRWEISNLLAESAEDNYDLNEANVANVLGLDIKKDDTLITIITNAIRLYAYRNDIDGVTESVLSDLDPKSHLEEASQEFNRRRGWYYETAEGRATLKNIVQEVSGEDLPEREFWKSYDKQK